MAVGEKVSSYLEKRGELLFTLGYSLSVRSLVTSRSCVFFPMMTPTIAPKKKPAHPSAAAFIFCSGAQRQCACNTYERLGLSDLAGDDEILWLRPLRKVSEGSSPNRL